MGCNCTVAVVSGLARVSCTGNIQDYFPETSAIHFNGIFRTKCFASIDGHLIFFGTMRQKNIK